LPDGNSVIKFVSGDLSIRDLLGNTIRDISIDWSSSETGQFSPDENLFATIGRDGGIYIWRVSDWQLLVTLQNSTNRSDSLAFSPDGLYIAIGSYNGTVSIWGIAP
jgi:WD40 repeat protein